MADKSKVDSLHNSINKLTGNDVTKKIVKLATSLGMLNAIARALPKNVNLGITADVSGAISALNKLQNKLKEKGSYQKLGFADKRLYSDVKQEKLIDKSVIDKGVDESIVLNSKEYLSIQKQIIALKLKAQKVGVEITNGEKQSLELLTKAKIILQNKININKKEISNEKEVVQNKRELIENTKAQVEVEKQIATIIDSVNIKINKRKTILKSEANLNKEKLANADKIHRKEIEISQIKGLSLKTQTSRLHNLYNLQSTLNHRILSGDKESNRLKIVREKVIRRIAILEGKISTHINNAKKGIFRIQSGMERFKVMLKSAVGNAFSLNKIMNRMAFVITAKLSYEAFDRVQRILSSIIKNSILLEEKMSTIFTLLDQNQKHLKGFLTKEVVDIMKNYGTDIETTTRAMYDLLSARIPPEWAGYVLEEAAKGALAGFTDIKIAGDALTTTLNSFNLSASHSADVMDWVFQIIKYGKTTLAELAPNIGKVTSAANVLGISMEEVGTSLATMTQTGIKTDVAITSLRQLMITLADPTDKAKEIFKKYNLQLDLAIIKKEGFAYAVRQLNGLTDDEIVTIAKSRRGFQALAVAMGRNNIYLENYNNMLNRAGAAQEAYEERSKTLRFQIDKLKQSFIAFGLSLQGIVLGVGKPLFAMFNNLLTVFSQWQTYVVIGIGVAIKFRSALLGLFAATEKVAVGFTTATTSAVVFNAALIKSVAVLAIIAITIAIGALIRKEKERREELEKWTQTVRNNIIAEQERLSNQERLIEDLYKLTKEERANSDIKEQLSERYQDLIDKGTDYATIIADITEKIEDMNEKETNAAVIKAIDSKTYALEKMQEARDIRESVTKDFEDAYQKYLEFTGKDAIDPIDILFGKVIPEGIDAVAQGFSSFTSATDEELQEWQKAVSKTMAELSFDKSEEAKEMLDKFTLAYGAISKVLAARQTIEQSEDIITKALLKEGETANEVYNEAVKAYENWIVIHKQDEDVYEGQIDALDELIKARRKFLFEKESKPITGKKEQDAEIVMIEFLQARNDLEKKYKKQQQEIYKNQISTTDQRISNAKTEIELIKAKQEITEEDRNKIAAFEKDLINLDRFKAAQYLALASLEDNAIKKRDLELKAEKLVSKEVLDRLKIKAEQRKENIALAKADLDKQQALYAAGEIGIDRLFAAQMAYAKVVMENSDNEVAVLKVKIDAFNLIKANYKLLSAEEQKSITLTEYVRQELEKLGIVADNFLKKLKHEGKDKGWNVYSMFGITELKTEEDQIGYIQNRIKEMTAQFQNYLLNMNLQFLAKKHQQNLDSIEKGKLAETDAVNATVLTQQHKVNALTALNEKYAKKKQEEEERYAKEKAEAERSKALFSIVIDVAKGIAAAIANLQLWFIPAIIAMGIAQSAIVSNAKYAKGGYTGSPSGVKDETGKRPAGIVHEEEFVFNDKATRGNVPLFYNMQEQLAKGKSFSNFIVDYLSNRMKSITIPRPQFAFASGGYATGNAGMVGSINNMAGIIGNLEYVSMDKVDDRYIYKAGKRGKRSSGEF